MKRSFKILCLLLCLSLLLAVPVHARESAEPRGSRFFSSYLTMLYKTALNSFEIWFDVDANAPVMDEIGATMIELYESADGEHWTLVQVYDAEDYPHMIDYNTSSHTGHVTYYYARPGYYYVAYVTYYAKNSTGIGKNFEFTQIMQM